MELNEINEKIKLLQALPVRRAFREWWHFFEKYPCENLCEIGVRTGANFDNLIKSPPKLAVAVDCWREDGTIGRNDICADQAELDKQYEDFKARMVDKPFVDIRRGYSFDLFKEFPDEYFDFIFIDADHTYEGCKKDLIDWWPKMKKGGVFCGHDYQHRRVRTRSGKIRFGVIEAVDEWVVGNKIPNFFLLKPSTWGVIKI